MDEPLLFSAEELAFLKSLEKEKVPFLIVGQSAALLQGAPVVTQDIDLWFAQVPSAELTKALQAVGGAYVPQIMLNPPMLVGKGLSQFDLVINIGGISTFAEEYQQALEIEVDGLKVKALSLEKIIKCKEFANRLKDQAALPALYAALAVMKKSQ